MRLLKRALKVVGIMLFVCGTILGVFVYVRCSQFDASMDRVYEVPVPSVARSEDPAVVARGDHLVHSIAACAGDLCHGADLGGGKPIEMGPVATLCAPNITPENMGAAYSDGELARLIKHGIKKDGRSVRFMPAQDISWLPDADVLAIVSYLRTVKPVSRSNGSSVIKTLGKVLDRQEQFVLDVARHIDHSKTEAVPPPEASAAYGGYVTRLCTGCHGEHYSGGPLPGAPSSFAIPLNLTPDDTGLKEWTFADYDKLMRTGVRRNGKQLDKLMPIEAWKNFDDTEMRATWAYLQTLPARTFGGR